jgi:protein-arginine kinase activator protein McsA
VPEIDFAAFVDACVGAQTSAAECPSCGHRREQYEETGFVGCPLCYVVFRPETP